MAVVNIPRHVKDEFYRYKMPALVAKVEGRGNGIKTVIVNMTDVAKSLDRPPAYPTKYFGFELGALTTIDPSKDRYIVNGKHDQSKLAQVLDTFIDRFVLCSNCRNPETKMLLRGGMIELKCAACGARSPVDMRHKLTTFIQKNPPTDGAGADEPTKREKKSKSTKQRKPKKNESDEEKDQDEDGEGEEDEDPKQDWEEDEKKQEQPKTPKKKDAEEVVWFTDTSKEAAEQRRRQMLDDTSALAAKLLGATKEREDPVDKIRKFASSGNPTADQILTEIFKVRDEEKMNSEQVAKLAFEALFGKDILKQLKPPKTDVLTKLAKDEKAASGLLDGLAELCGVKETELLKSVPHVLKALYDQDVVGEDAIISWYEAKSTGPAAKVKESGKVFVDWLRTAEEESDEDEESD